MPTVIQFRRGTTAQNDAFLGANGEITIDTQLHTVRLHDGVTVGGHVISGFTGSTGAAGYTGSAGVNGTVGYTGSAGTSGANRLDQLQDVVESTPANGAILTYSSSDDKYYVLPLNVSDTTISNTILDGGLF